MVLKHGNDINVACKKVSRCYKNELILDNNIKKGYKLKYHFGNEYWLSRYPF